jgi:hypothetical protein
VVEIHARGEASSTITNNLFKKKKKQKTKVRHLKGKIIKWPTFAGLS